MTRLLRLLGVLSVLTATALSAASPATYAALVAAYRNRDDASVSGAAALTMEELSAIPEQLSLSDWDTADVLAAAMLHLDAYERLLRLGRSEDAFRHVNCGGRFVDAALARSRQVESFARSWYGVATVIAEEQQAPTWADELRARASARFPRTDAVELFAEGLKLELQGVMAEPTSRSSPRWDGPRDPVALRWFQSAADRFAKAESLDRALLDAALHQGRSRMLAGEATRAIAPLERASRSPEKRVRYLAVMLLGALAEGGGRLGEADSRYRAAAAIAPFAQSAPLALAHLLARLDRTTDARAVLEGHFARTRGRVAEPMWTYLGTPDDHLRETLENLRAEVWR